MGECAALRWRKWRLLASVTKVEPAAECLPPNPPAVSVAIGEEGVFPLTGLLMIGPVDLAADCTVESGTAVLSPPYVNGEPDSSMTFRVRLHRAAGRDVRDHPHRC